MATKKKFAEVLKMKEDALKPPCAVCKSSDRADIEAAKKRGVPNTLIGQTMKSTGDIGEDVSADRAATRVSDHFKNHPLLGQSERVSTK